MQIQYIAESQSQFLIEGQPQSKIQIQYQSQPQNQLQQYQVQPIILLQQQQASPISVTQQNLVIDDSNFLSEMCCILVWLIMTVIPCLGTILFLRGYYLYLNLIYIIAAISIIIAICSKNEIIYKVGYVFYYIDVILNIISSLVILIIAFSTYADELYQYLGIISFGDNSDSIEKSLQVYQVIFLVAIFIQIFIASVILNCLKKKIKVFKAYNNYVKSKQSGLIQQPNTA